MTVKIMFTTTCDFCQQEIGETNGYIHVPGQQMMIPTHYGPMERTDMCPTCEKDLMAAFKLMREITPEERKDYGPISERS